MTASLLTTIDGPAAVKELGLDQLKVLCEELRGEILRVTAANGGHLATNLGIVELSVALHYVLDTPRDRIIWDVGNQCYAHKIITGRRERFSTIRQQDGLSGFVNRQESPHDHMTAGHAGTALSAALGIASAREQLRDDYRVVAVVGDGAMSCGLSYEALNNLGTFGSQMLLILNDNAISISPSRGALSKSLKKAQDKVLDGSIFEELGVQYLGPVDGHDLPLMLEVLNESTKINGPVVLHIITQKGRGYPRAVQDATRYHGVPAFDIATGKSLSGSGGAPTYSDLFGREMLKIAAEDQRVVAVTAAMVPGTGLAEFAAKFPDRCIDVGIAEPHAVTFAGGLAIGGCRPVVAIYSTFLQRSFDQVVHDVCLQDLPVTFVLDRAGVVGADGPTHHGVFDFTYLRTIPRMVVMAPRDGDQFKLMLRAAIAYDGPAAVRIPRGPAPETINPRGEFGGIEIGRAELLREGNDVGLIAIGSMVTRALQAADTLQEDGISACVLDARFAKPLDADLIIQTARRVKRLYTIEEHVGQGGFGSAVLELLAGHNVGTPVSLLALPDEFVEHGSTDGLLDECGLSVGKIVARVLSEFKRGPSSGHPSEIPTMDPQRLRAAISRIHERALPDDLAYWVDEYGKVGERDAFLWKWVLEGLDLTELSSVDPQQRDANRVTKALGVMLDVLLDDVADQAGDPRYLDQLLRIPFAASPPDFVDFSREQQAYAATTCGVWNAILTRAKSCPRFDEFETLLRFDYRQLFNVMRYSHMLNGDPRLLNLAEHDLYLPHNMHMMVSGTLDLMCSPAFDRAEIGAIREALWHAQCMGRIGNLVTTWEREIAERDFTSGVFALAVRSGVATVDDLANGDPQTLRNKIAESHCESYFLERWCGHREKLRSLVCAARTVDLARLISGLERLLETHLGSRGLK